MARTVPAIIIYHKAGTQPPLFVAGTFSEPPWDPQEMDFTTDSDGEHVFKKQITAEEGSQVHYKFRVGLGDWWVNDEEAAYVTDDAGNRNNVLTIPIEKAAKKTLDVGSEADSTKLRRLSTTPIPEVAETAAEVADTAAVLDDERHDENDEAVADGDHHDDFEGSIPMFAHECLDLDDESSQVRRKISDSRHSSSRDADENQYDINDPTLERLPSSDRLSIVEAIKKMEAGINEDHTDQFEGVPPSPVVGGHSRNTSGDLGDHANGSPPESPIIIRGSRRLAVPRAEQWGSMSSERSAISLGSIAEDEEAAESSPVIIPSPVIKSQPGLKEPTSDEDEAIALHDSSRKVTEKDEASDGDLTPEAAASPITEPTDNPKETEPSIPNSISIPVPTLDQQNHVATESSARDSSHAGPEIDNEERPSIIVQTAEEDEADRTSPEPSEQDTEETAATSTATDAVPGTLRRRPGAAVRRGSSPNSVHSHAKDGAGGSFVTAFFRVLFVDWIGGFINRLCGSRRKALLSGAVMVIAGTAGYRLLHRGSSSSGGIFPWETAL